MRISRKAVLVLCCLLEAQESASFSPCCPPLRGGLQKISSCNEKSARAPFPTTQALSANDKNEEFVDAVIENIEAEEGTLAADDELPPRRRKRDIFKEALRNLAKLSLIDYQWRSSVFKSAEADRLVEESVARMLGEDAAYVRPMDASDERIGPLGKAEKNAVGWLSQVIEEEGKRAAKIAKGEGELVRPIDSASVDELGPLGGLEKKAVDFFESIRNSEKERMRSGVLRPKDVEEGKRGPLGDCEAKAVLALEEIRQSEMTRMEQSRQRGGTVVRPIDVPGPLGEFERKVLDVFKAEKQRVKDREDNDGKLVRPKDSSVRGPLGEAESAAMKTVESLTEEERDRLRNLQRYLEENRPMESDRNSLLGATEAVVVGILRAPQMLVSVADRVKELLKSESLDLDDQEMLKELRLPPTENEEEQNRQPPGE